MKKHPTTHGWMLFLTNTLNILLFYNVENLFLCHLPSHIIYPIKTTS